MAHAHYMYPTTFLNLHIKNTRKNSYTRKDLDFYDNQEFFDLLAMKSILTKEELHKMSLRSQEGYLFINQSLYPPQQIRRLIDKRTHFGLMYCPKCLETDEIPYWRKKWRYFFYTACPKHKIFLTDRCWHCYKPIKLLKMELTNKIKFCSNCGADLGLTDTHQDNTPDDYGLESIRWFEEGLERGYFEINGQKVWSVMFFHIFCRLYYLLDRKQDLVLKNFSKLDEYKSICKKLEVYNSKKASAIYKTFYVNSMIYHLFQNFPFNFLDFIELNHLTYREFTHGLKYIPFWYELMLKELIPKENKIGRRISASEVIGAINYLKRQNKIVNQKNVAEVVGCHFTIHKEFVSFYKMLITEIKRY
tara:strand:- start:829 stop:1911 length:1083 start_codon:yes stop_codon:yes gene_type:complete